jgi:hypothetical protein
MIEQIIVAGAIIYLINRKKKKRNTERRGRSRRVVRSEMAQWSERFQNISLYFDPETEREKLAYTFHQLLNSPDKHSQEYKNTCSIVKSLVLVREQDVALTKSLGQLKERYARSGDTFSDKLRSMIEKYLEEVERLLDQENFAADIDEIKLNTRYLAWLVAKGEEGRDNSVHWEVESRDELEAVWKKVEDERLVWEDLQEIKN